MEDSASLPALASPPADTTSVSAGPGMVLVKLRPVSVVALCAVKGRALCCAAAALLDGMGMGMGWAGIAALAVAAAVALPCADVEVTMLSEMVLSHVPDTAGGATMQKSAR